MGINKQIYIDKAERLFSEIEMQDSICGDKYDCPYLASSLSTTEAWGVVEYLTEYDCTCEDATECPWVQDLIDTGEE